MAMQPTIACQNRRDVWLYNQMLCHRKSDCFEGSIRGVQLIARPGMQYSFSHISRNPGYDSNRVRSLLIFHLYCIEFRRYMGTSPIIPCYDVERFETKTHVGLNPGESIEYTKHCLSHEGNLWPECRPVSDTWHPYNMDRPSKGGA